MSVALDIEIPVFAQEDTIYLGTRTDPNLRLMYFQRPAKTVIARAPMFLQLPRPPAFLFEDKFISVYPVLEAFQQPARPPPGTPLFALTHISNRLDEPNPEDYTHRVDLTQLYRYRVSITGLTSVMGFMEEILDLNDNPWLEWVPAPINHPINFHLFRIYPQPSVLFQWNLYYSLRVVVLDIPVEVDSVNRQFDATNFQMLSRHPYIVPASGLYPAVVLQVFEIEPTLGNITLIWSASLGAAGYRLYIDGVPQAAVMPISQQTITFTGLPLNTQFTYNIVAVNGQGVDSSSLSNTMIWEHGTTEVITSVALPWEDAGTLSNDDTDPLNPPDVEGEE